MRITNSFSEGEIQVMDFIVQTLLRGGSPTMATRNKDFSSLCRKIMAMKAKVNEHNLEQQIEEERKKKEHAASEDHGPSVGDDDDAGPPALVLRYP